MKRTAQNQQQSVAFITAVKKPHAVKYLSEYTSSKSGFVESTYPYGNYHVFIRLAGEPVAGRGARTGSRVPTGGIRYLRSRSANSATVHLEQRGKPACPEYGRSQRTPCKRIYELRDSAGQSKTDPPAQRGEANSTVQPARIGV